MVVRRTLNLSGLAAISILLLALTACGSGANPSGGSSSSSPAASTASGPQADLAAAAQAAKKEKVTVVGHPGPQYDGVIEAFKKAYPDIPIEYNGDRPSTFTPKMLTEQKNGVYNWDVWWMRPRR